MTLAWQITAVIIKSVGVTENMFKIFVIVGKSILVKVRVKSK